MRKISINLPEVLSNLLIELAGSDAVSQTEIIRRSVMMYKVLDTAVKEGKLVVFLDPKTKKAKQVNFKQWKDNLNK